MDQSVAGVVDGYWELRLKPWDMSAGVIIAREAGAKITQMVGWQALPYPECAALPIPNWAARFCRHNQEAAVQAVDQRMSSSLHHLFDLMYCLAKQASRAGRRAIQPIFKVNCCGK